jgi:hypothetical protein
MAVLGRDRTAGEGGFSARPRGARTRLIEQGVYQQQDCEMHRGVS